MTRANPCQARRSGCPEPAAPRLRLLSPAPATRPSRAALERGELENADARRVVRWAADAFGDGLVLSTSFGIQAAVMLHLVTREVPDIPVIWVDTGYLPPETYRFAEELRERLRLDLKVYQSELSPARMEALHGRLWEPQGGEAAAQRAEGERSSENSGDLERLNCYDRLRKVEPMQRALGELGATAWLSGLRADQTRQRAALARIGEQDGRAKILPILHWTARDVHRYLKRHNLPYHPLFEKGYATVGDWHSSRPVTAEDRHERETRFRGLKQECGIHLTEDQAKSLESSRL